LNLSALEAEIEKFFSDIASIGGGHGGVKFLAVEYLFSTNLNLYRNHPRGQYPQKRVIRISFALNEKPFTAGATRQLRETLRRDTRAFLTGIRTIVEQISPSSPW
jgi:hypothetical protein